MRIPIALSLLILMIGLILGWHDHQQFAMVRANHDQLVAEAAESGITFDPTFPDKGVFIAKRERKNDEEETKKLSAAIIALLNESEVLEKTGVPPTEAMRNQHRDYLFRARSLDLAQLKIFISEVHANVDLEDKTRQGILGHLIPYFSHINPQAGLELYRESADLLNRDGFGKQIIPSSLAKWAKDDPAAAVGWLRKNGGNFSDLLNDDAKGGLISGAAANEPKLAFRLIEELEFKDSDSAIRRIADAAKTADGRSATLVALREYLATHPGGEMQRAASIYALRSLVTNAANEGFEAGSRWIASAGFPPEQLMEISDFTDNVNCNETGRWVEWLGENLPDGKSNDRIRTLVRKWTERDYQSAGEWLVATPESPAKSVSIRAYAETVSRYDPGTASQWANALPPGTEREETLKSIYQNWPDKDTAGKEDFSKAHGIN